MRGRAGMCSDGSIMLGLCISSCGTGQLVFGAVVCWGSVPAQVAQASLCLCSTLGQVYQRMWGQASLCCATYIADLEW